MKKLSLWFKDRTVTSMKMLSYEIFRVESNKSLLTFHRRSLLPSSGLVLV
jgi:hypothetical protein